MSGSYFRSLGAKVRSFGDFSDTSAQTIREIVFLTLSMYLMLSGMSWLRETCIRSFWRLLASSTLNNFSSEKRIWSSLPGANRVLSCLHLSSRLLRMDSLRWCTFFSWKTSFPDSPQPISASFRDWRRILETFFALNAGYLSEFDIYHYSSGLVCEQILDDQLVSGQTLFISFYCMVYQHGNDLVIF